MFDIVIPYKQTESEELKYAIKCANKWIPYRNIYVIGDDPGLDVIHIQHKKEKWQVDRYDDVRSKLIQACDDSRISNDILLMNDDQFILKPLDQRCGVNGDIQQTLENYKTYHPYCTMMERTLKCLQDNGKSTWNYACHRPMWMQKDLLKWLLSEVVIKRSMSIQTLYGNWFDVPHFQTQNAKNLEDFVGVDVISTDELTFERDYKFYIEAKLNGS